MRRYFNGRRIDESARLGELLGPYVHEDALAPPRDDLLPGTRSQRVTYHNPPNVLIAEAHRYLQPDGTLGGSGRPDPKWLLVDEEEWYPCHADDECCLDCPPHRQDGWSVLDCDEVEVTD